MLLRKNWILLPEWRERRKYSSEIKPRKIIGLDVETNIQYPHDKIYMIQIWSDDLQRVFFPDSEEDMFELALYFV